MSEKRSRDWRNINVRRNRQHEPIVEKLCARNEEYSGKPIFEFNKDLMVFAAVLGYAEGRSEELGSDSIQITLGTYASDEKDGFIYLLALLDEEDAACLKDEKLSESIKTFERYCNGGLGLISEWLQENPADIGGVDTIVSRMLQQINDSESSEEAEGLLAQVDF